MRIACLDKTAADRTSLVDLVDSALETCRETIGHSNAFLPFPATRHDISINQSIDAIVVGKGFSIEEAISACRDASEEHPSATIIALVKPEDYSVKSLKRFERFTKEVFAGTFEPVRFVHQLVSTDIKNTKSHQGKLLVLEGAKGGVGTTSLATGLAHAAQAQSKRAIIIDLSAHGVLCHYLITPRWQSPEYAGAISGELVVDEALVKKCISTSPNEISVLLPPSGGIEIRERWLRSAESFEVSLAIIDHLVELYDVVIVDLADAEGILPFALSARAHARLLVTSNDPASLHLTHARLSELTTSISHAPVHIILQELAERGMRRDDVWAFLKLHEQFQPSMALTPSLRFDSNAWHWIGSGNSFYTEASKTTQAALEQICSLVELDKSALEHQAHQTTLGIAEDTFIKSPRLLESTLKKLTWRKPKGLGWNVKTKNADAPKTNSSQKRLELLQPRAEESETIKRPQAFEPPRSTAHGS